jgi:3-oxoacyl-[acyl-carrier-protein] synthase II
VSKIKCVVVGYDLVTAYGWGVDVLWKGLLSADTAIKKIRRFSADQFSSQNAATLEGVDAKKNDSYVMQMLKPLLSKLVWRIPEDAFLILATTVGEIDLCERFILGDRNLKQDESRPGYLLNKVRGLCGLKQAGELISAACISSSAAIAQGAAMIASGERDCVLIVACDSVNEFVFSGFSALMALDPDRARPFDKNRRGLSVGEGAGLMLLMSQDRALKEKRKIIAQICGYALACDANHMSGPSRDGSGLALAIKKALICGKVFSKEIGSIAAHGTGTPYNDSMELKAFKSVFGKKRVPSYSIKGGTGHTMGAAGLIEAVVAIKSLEEKLNPATLNLDQLDREALGFIYKEPVRFKKDFALSTNSGFGGLNSALLIKKW